MPDHYTIGPLARAAGVPTSTVRYYERRGLVRPDSRNSGNYRVYTNDALERLRFVRSAQAAGFTLSDISALLGLRDSDAAPCKEVQNLIAARLDRVVEQAKHLKVIDGMLREWLTVCREAEQTGRCGVLAGLQSATNENSPKPRENP